MQMVRIIDLKPGDLFATGPGKTAEIGKVLALHPEGGPYESSATYEDQYGHTHWMRGKFMVWVD